MSGKNTKDPSFIFHQSSEGCKSRSLTASVGVGANKIDLKCRAGLRNWVAVIGMFVFILWIVYIILVTTTFEFTESGIIKYRDGKSYKTMSIYYYSLMCIPYVVIIIVLLVIRKFAYISLSKYGDNTYLFNKLRVKSEEVIPGINLQTTLNNCESKINSKECVAATFYNLNADKKVIESGCMYNKDRCVVDPQTRKEVTGAQSKIIKERIKKTTCGSRTKKDVCEIDGVCKFKKNKCSKKFQWSEIGKGQAIFSCDLCDNTTTRCSYKGRSWVFCIIFFIFGILLFIFAGTMGKEIDLEESEKLIRCIEYSSYGLGAYYILLGCGFFFLAAYCPDGSNIRLGKADNIYRTFGVLAVVLIFVVIIGSPLLSIYV